MSVADKIPTMSDADLATLRINAERLLTSENAHQRNSANELMPLILAEIASRTPPEPPPAPPPPRKVAKAKAPKVGRASCRERV